MGMFLLFVCVLGASALVGYLAGRPAPTWTDAASTSSPTPAATIPVLEPTPTPTVEPPITYPQHGPGTYAYASGGTDVVGTAGTLRTYKVGVEDGISVSADSFAAAVDATLGDPRSWIAGNNVRLQRVSTGSSNFTVILVSPWTAQKLCLEANLGIIWHGEPYTSCRSGSRVVINVARWAHAIPDYGTDIQQYRQYAINHEVGHALGHGHEKCPGVGQLAPTMQQQTFGLLGCTKNPWPYIDGKRYAGPPGTVTPPDN
jgi:hypothetical protein